MSLNNLLTCTHYLVQPTITLGVIFQSWLLRAVKLFRKHFYLLEPPLVVKKRTIYGRYLLWNSWKKNIRDGTSWPEARGQNNVPTTPLSSPSKSPKDLWSQWKLQWKYYKDVNGYCRLVSLETYSLDENSLQFSAFLQLTKMSKPSA